MKSSWFAVAFFTAALLFAAMGGINTSIRAKTTDAKTKAAQVARGEYLVTLMGCNDCHTPGSFYGSPDFQRRLSGSEMGWKGPWGVTYARNLTPDGATGIGSWSDKQIVAALRTGMRPDGSVLQPPMPWPNYTQLTDEDAYAIASYLKNIPAVAHKSPDRLTPDQPAVGAVMEIPRPPAWDAPREMASKGGPGNAGGK